MIKLAVAAGAAVLALAAAGCGSSRSATDVVQAFADEMIAQNFSAACQFYSDEQLGQEGVPREQAVRDCALNYTAAVGQALVLGGIYDPFGGTQVLAGSERSLPDGRSAVTLIDCAGFLGAQDVLVRGGQIVGFEEPHGGVDQARIDAQCAAGRGAAGGVPAVP